MAVSLCDLASLVETAVPGRMMVGGPGSDLEALATGGVVAELEIVEGVCVLTAKSDAVALNGAAVAGGETALCDGDDLRVGFAHFEVRSDFTRSLQRRRGFRPALLAVDVTPQDVSALRLRRKPGSMASEVAEITRPGVCGAAGVSVGDVLVAIRGAPVADLSHQERLTALRTLGRARVTFHHARAPEDPVAPAVRQRLLRVVSARRELDGIVADFEAIAADDESPSGRVRHARAQYRERRAELEAKLQVALHALPVLQPPPAAGGVGVELPRPPAQGLAAPRVPVPPPALPVFNRGPSLDAGWDVQPQQPAQPVVRPAPVLWQQQPPPAAVPEPAAAVHRPALPEPLPEALGPLLAALGAPPEMQTWLMHLASDSEAEELVEVFITPSHPREMVRRVAEAAWRARTPFVDLLELVRHVPLRAADFPPELSRTAVLQFFASTLSMTAPGRNSAFHAARIVERAFADLAGEGAGVVAAGALWEWVGHPGLMGDPGLMGGGSTGPTAAPAAAPPPAADATAERRLECPVCLDKEKNVVIVPCGHTLCCVCVDLLETCPICRGSVVHVVPFHL